MYLTILLKLYGYARNCLRVFFGFFSLFVWFWFCMRVTFYFLGIIAKYGSTKRPCFLQFFRFTVNGHIERDSACLTDQDGSLLYILCKRNVTKWEYTQVRGQISSSSSIIQNNIAFFYPQISFRSRI